MSTVSPVSPARVATALTAASGSAGGDAFANTGKQLLFIEHTNGAGADVTLTIATNRTVDGLTVPDKTITITKGTKQILGPFPTETYNDGDDLVNFSYDDETDIEIAVIQMP